MILLYNVFLWLGLLTIRVLTVDSLLNFTSSLNLQQRVREVVIKSVNSIENVYIYYNNNTIIKYSNSLVPLQYTKLNGSFLSTFSTLNIDYPTYYGVVQGGSQILMINQSDSKNYSIKDWTGIVHAELLTFSTIYGYISYGFIIWKADVVFRQQFAVPNYNFINDQKNFTSISPNRNYVLKVLRVNTPTNYYFITFTSNKQVYFLSYSRGKTAEATTFTFVKHDRILESWRISNFSIISHVIDKDQIVIIQFADFKLFAFYLINGTEVKVSQNLNNLVGTSILKKISPNIFEDGERTFVFNDKTVRVNLISNSYDLLAVSHEAYPITNWTGLTILSSNYSFVYRKNDSRVYGFCYTSVAGVTLTSCENEIKECMIQNCKQCNKEWTACILCQDGYQSFNQKCYRTETCEVINCNICEENKTCVFCENNLTLFSENNTCGFLSNTNDTENSNDQKAKTNDTANSDNSMANTNNTEYLNGSTENNTKMINKTQIQGNNGVIYNTDLIKKDFSNNDLSFFKNIDPSHAQFLFQNLTDDKLNKLWNAVTDDWREIASIFSQMIQTPGAKTSLGFLQPLFGFLDDYWYYIYHEDNYTQLQIIPRFLAFMNQCNQDRIIPDYLRLDYPAWIKNNPLKKSNYTLYTPQTILKIDRQQTFFYQNIKPMLFQQYFFNIIIIILFKLLLFALKFIFLRNSKVSNQNVNFENSSSPEENALNNDLHYQSQKRSCMKKIFSKNTLFRIVCYVKKSVKFKNIIKMFIGVNLMFITFYYASQVRFMSSFSAFDKVNMGLTVIFGLILITYFSIQMLYEDLVSVNDSKINNNQKRISRQDTYLINVKCILCGFVHGFFIKSLMDQYILLIVIKSFLIWIIASKDKIQQKKSKKVLLVIYFGGGIFIDILCILSTTLSMPNSLNEEAFKNFRFIEIVEICVIGLISIPIFLQMCFQIFEKPLQRLLCNMKATEIGIQTRKQIEQNYNWRSNSLEETDSFPIDPSPSRRLDYQFENQIKRWREKTMKRICIQEKQDSLGKIDLKSSDSQQKFQQKRKKTYISVNFISRLEFKLKENLEQNNQTCQIQDQNVQPLAIQQDDKKIERIFDAIQSTDLTYKGERSIKDKARTLKYREIRSVRNIDKMASLTINSQKKLYR